MKDLASFLIKNISGSDDFSVSEREDDNKIDIGVAADKSIIGLIIGKEGKNIKNIRRIMSVLATMKNKVVNISIEEKKGQS